MKCMLMCHVSSSESHILVVGVGGSALSDCWIRSLWQRREMHIWYLSAWSYLICDDFHYLFIPKQWYNFVSIAIDKWSRTNKRPTDSQLGGKMLLQSTLTACLNKRWLVFLVLCVTRTKSRLQRIFVKRTFKKNERFAQQLNKSTRIWDQMPGV